MLVLQHIHTYAVNSSNIRPRFFTQSFPGEHPESIRFCNMKQRGFLPIYRGRYESPLPRSPMTSGGGCVLDIVHGRSRMTIDPRIPTMPGWSMLGFHRAGRHCGGERGWGCSAHRRTVIRKCVESEDRRARTRKLSSRRNKGYYGIDERGHALRLHGGNSGSGLKTPNPLTFLQYRSSMN